MKCIKCPRLTVKTHVAAYRRTATCETLGELASMTYADRGAAWAAVVRNLTPPKECPVRDGN